LQASAHSTSPADARSILQLRFSVVSCAIPSRLGPSDAAPSSPKLLPAHIIAPRLAPRKPQLPLQPHAQPPRPTARTIIHAHPAFASTHSQRSCRRCTQRTAEVQRRQLRHPFETRCQRRCPSVVDLIVCTHHGPSARPSQIRPPLQPRAQPPRPTARTIIHAHPAFASTRSQRSCRRCTQRTAEVQRRQLRHPSETLHISQLPTLCDFQSAQANQLTEAFAVKQHAVVCDCKPCH
jgi:hypothetical protein